MKMAKVSDLFQVQYGLNLELNALKQSPAGIPFVSRTARNNGVSAYVEPVPGVAPLPAGTITVAGGGSVMATFLQPNPYYSGRDLYYLTPLVEMTDQEKLFYCACLRANAYRFNYGRQANRTLKDILVPPMSRVPAWVKRIAIAQFENAANAARPIPTPALTPTAWSSFTFDQLFRLKKGKRLTKANMRPGSTPFIGAIDHNNGLTAQIDRSPAHEANTITVNYNGNGVAQAYYQPIPFWATDDVNVLYPRFPLSPAIAMFLITIIQREQYRFSYGRKWHLARMRTSIIRLPATRQGDPDWPLIERYINSLPYSSQCQN